MISLQILCLAVDKPIPLFAIGTVFTAIGMVFLVLIIVFTVMITTGKCLYPFLTSTTFVFQKGDRQSLRKLSM